MPRRHPGRTQGREPIAYSLSAQQGRDERGATAMLKSLARLPHNRAAGASAAIIELDPAVVRGETGVERLTTLIRAALAMDIGQLQFNVVTRKAPPGAERPGTLRGPPGACRRLLPEVQLVPPICRSTSSRTKHTSTA